VDAARVRAQLLFAFMDLFPSADFRVVEREDLPPSAEEVTCPGYEGEVDVAGAPPPAPA
jgi:hypothetical protein